MNVPQVYNEENPEWRIIVQSVQGATHERSGKPNQDAQYPLTTKKAVMLAISDGHGSDKYFRSDRGSRIAVNVAVAVLADFINNIDARDMESIDEKRGLWLSEQTARLPQLIVERWRQAVEDDRKKFPFFEKEDEKQFRKQSALLAEIDKNPFIPYGATLLAVLVTKTFICCFQLGDGDITFVRDNGKTVSPMKEDKRLLANETTSLCTRTAPEDFRRKFYRRVNDPPALIMLSTDGYANSFSTHQGFLKVGRDILQKLYEDNGLSEVDRQFKEWLQTATQAGSGDDITVGLMCYLPIVNKRPVPTIEPLPPDEVVENVQQQAPHPYYSQPEGEGVSGSGSKLPAKPIKEPKVALTKGQEIAPTLLATSGTGLIKKPGEFVKGDENFSSPRVYPSAPPPESVPEQPAGQQQQENKLGPPQKIVVSQEGKGDCETIQEALDLVAPDGIIYVGPGVYQESLQINKSIRLKARREGKSVCIRSAVPCLVIEAQNVIVEGFEIIGREETQNPPKEPYAVKISEKGCKIIECDISARSQYGVLVRGAETQAVLRMCRIHHAQVLGVHIRGKRSSLELENCTIQQTGTGVYIENNAHARISGGFINNNNTGVYLWNGTLGIDGCDLSNGQNIVIQKTKQASVTDCTFGEIS